MKSGWKIIYGLWIILFLGVMTIQTSQWLSLPLPAAIAQNILWALISIVLIPVIVQTAWGFFAKELTSDEGYKIDQEVSWHYGRNVWLGLLLLLVGIFFFYLLFWGVPYLFFGLTMSETKGFLLPFIPMFAQILPFWFILPFVYFFAFFGPFVFKVFLVDMKIHLPYSLRGASFEDIIGQDQAIKRIKEILKAHRNFEEFRKIGGKPRFNMVLIGGPGTGKTLAARAIASTQGKPFIEVLPSITYQTFIGVDIIGLWIIFLIAGVLSLLFGGCYVFYDEFENLARQRRITGPYAVSSNANGNNHNGNVQGRLTNFVKRSVYMPIPYGAMGTGGATTLLLAKLSGGGASAPIWYLVPQLLVNGIFDAIYVASFGLLFPPRLKADIFNGFLDFLHLPSKIRFKDYVHLRLPSGKVPPSRVIHIGATNMFEALDEAIRTRPERFQFIEFDMPGISERLQFINYFLDVKKFPHDPDLDKPGERMAFALACDRFNFDQMEQCFHTAQQGKYDAVSVAGEKVNRKTVAINIEELGDARNTIKHGFAKSGRTSKENLDKVAYHESGHLVAQRYCDKDGVRIPIHFSAVRRSRSLGRLETPEEYPEDPHDQKFWEDEICVLLASHAAEREFFGFNTTGVVQDLESATIIACKMVNNWGMWAESDEDELKKKYDRYAKKGVKILSSGSSQESQMFIRESMSLPEKRKEVKVILGKAYEKAEKIVRENKKTIQAAFNALKEHHWEMSGTSVSELYFGLEFKNDDEAADDEDAN